MDIKEVFEGLHVKIGPSIARTHRRFNSCSDMSRMKGKMYRIDAVMEHDDSVSINGFTWDIQDIEEVEVEIPEQIVHFDAQELAI